MTPEMITKSNDKAVKGVSVVSKTAITPPTSSKALAPTPAKIAPAVNMNATAVAASVPVAPGSPSALKRKVMGAETAVAPEMPSAIHLRREDAAAAWQSRPRVPSRLMDTYVNFMVLGKSHVGCILCAMTVKDRSQHDRVAGPDQLMR